MLVRELSLENFRNFEHLRVKLDKGVTIVYGDNANGKTNFIEAIYFCATGRSRRAGHDSELIRFDQKEAHLQTVVDNEGICDTIDVHLFKDGKNGRRKGIAINHIPIKKLSQLFGLLLAVIFMPEDLRIVKAGPTERRAFMDLELCQLSPKYYHALRRYHHALKQRNKLLKTISKNRSLLETIFVWDAPLCEYGLQIMVEREIFIKQIGEFARAIHSDITGGAENLTITYRPQITDPNRYAERLRQNTERDIAIGSTSIGIHKDDLNFTINGNDTRTYGSQGQQRTAALSTKLAEIEIIKTHTKKTPVLLLDDVLSELDENRQKFLLQYINNLQTILTSTDASYTEGKLLKMVNGKIVIV